MVSKLFKSFTSIEFDCVGFCIDNYANPSNFRCEPRQPRYSIRQEKSTKTSSLVLQTDREAAKSKYGNLLW